MLWDYEWSIEYLIIKCMILFAQIWSWIIVCHEEQTLEILWMHWKYGIIEQKLILEKLLN